MTNLLEKLRKENNERDKQLTKENGLIMMDMVVYLRHSNLCDYDIEVIRRDLFAMIYEAQLRNEPARQVIGDNYKSFCEELMENGRQKTFQEKFLEWAYIVIVGAGVLFVIELVFSGVILELFTQRDTAMTISLGFVTSTVLIVAGAVAIYWYVTKFSFELPGRGMTKYRVLLMIGFWLFFTGSIMIKVWLGDINLFTVNVFIPLAVFAAAYFAIKVLGTHSANRIAETHN